MTDTPSLACARVRVLLEPYVDGDLTRDDALLAVAVRQHLAGCADCHRQHDQAMSLPFRLKALSSPPPPVLPEGALAAFILWYLSGLDGLSSIASGVFDDLQSLAGWAPGRVRCRGFPRLTLSFCSLCSRSPRSPPTISRSSSAWPPAPCPTGASRVSEAPRPHHLRRWAWPLLIGVLAAAGILLALADISAGGRWPNPLAEALVGPAAVQRHSQSGQNVTLRFDRSRISETSSSRRPSTASARLVPTRRCARFSRTAPVWSSSPSPLWSPFHRAHATPSSASKAATAQRSHSARVW